MSYKSQTIIHITVAPASMFSRDALIPHTLLMIIHINAAPEDTIPRAAVMFYIL